MRYAHLLSRLYNTPLAISEAKLSTITKAVTLKLLEGEPVGSMGGDVGRPEGGSPTLPASWGLIEIFGSLVSKNGAGESGCTSYAYITEEVNEAIAEGKTHIIFSIDSHGGEVSGNFALASFIASLPTKYGIQTFAFVDGYACSAAYTLASACTQVIATPSSFLGSIGVIMTLIDRTEEDKLEGEKYTILRSRANKALYNPHEKLTKGVISEAEATLSQLDTLMVECITSSRPALSVETIATLDGRAVLASEALTVTLCDEVVDSFDIFAQSLLQSSVSQPPSPRQVLGRTFSMNLEQALARVQALELDLATAKAEAQASATASALAERTRVVSILEAAKLTGMASALTASHIKSGTTEAVAVEIFTGIKAGMDAAVSASIGGATMQGTLNPQVLPVQATAPDLKPLAGGTLSVADLIKAMTQGESHA